MEHILERPELAHFDPPGYQQAWDMVVGQLRMEMRRSDYETWVAALQPLSYKEGVYLVGAVNIYGREWVESRLRTKIRNLLESILNQPVKLNFVLLRGNERPILGDLEQAAPTVDLPENPQEQARYVPRKTSRFDALDEKIPDTKNTPRKMQLQRAYGEERARIIQPERVMVVTFYFLDRWLPLLGQSAVSLILEARRMCYWNVMTGEMRNVFDTDMEQLANKADLSVRTVKNILKSELVRRYFLRYKVRRNMTPDGVRTAGITLVVRMDDPLTPEDQEEHRLPESEHWYTADFADERDESD